MTKPTKKSTLPRGRDELPFLGSRSRSTPLGEMQARERTNEVARRGVAFDQHQAAEAHDQGSELIELYMRHADVVLGYRTFDSYLRETWPLDVSVAYERMRIARLCTHDQAVKWGYTVCVLGLRIMALLGVDDFDEFRKRPLKLHREQGGGTVHFPAPTTSLRSVLRELATRAAAGHAHDVDVQFRRYRAAVDELSEADEEVAALRPTVWCDRKGVYSRVTVSGARQSRAAAKLFQKLARLGD